MTQETRVFKLLSDPNRIAIFMLLMDDEYCVCDIERLLNMKQSNVSKHLMAFKKLSLLECRKHSTWNHYRLSKSSLSELRELCDYLRKSSSYIELQKSLRSFEKSVCGTEGEMT